MAKLSCPSSAIILLLALSFIFKISHAGGEGSLRPDQCAAACEFRCSATSHQKPCLFFCNKCCAQCLCVPSGTFGNKEECPCYNNWKTQEGTSKCP